MLYRKLGNTGFDVSLLGFGVWQIGGGRWHSNSEKENIEILQAAQKLGINIFDAAVVYGQYKDERGYLQSRAQELLGKAFKNKRSEVFYCLKLGQFDEYSHRSNFEPERIVDQFKQSLRRLQTDYVDILLIHAPSLEKVKNGKAIAVAKTLQALGLVKAIGYSFENEPEHVRAALTQDIDVIMLQYNLIDTECKEAIKEAEEYGIGVLVGGPLKRGYLTGNFKKIEDLPLIDDYWKWNLQHNRGKVEQVLKKVLVLLEKNTSPKGLRRSAFEHILKESGVSAIVVGNRTMKEIEENAVLIEETQKSLQSTKNKKLNKRHEK
ncbi:MAG: aldo/keto reductase [Patescibacteria group bacterium]